MLVDLFLKAIGTMACLNTIGFFVSMLTVNALNAVTATAGTPCAGHGCVAAYQDTATPAAAPDLLQQAAMFVAVGL